jgi:hypothetical protein
MGRALTGILMGWGRPFKWRGATPLAQQRKGTHICEADSLPQHFERDGRILAR